MFINEKRLLYPIDITNKDLYMAKLIVTQYGGPNGELGAAIRYINQAYTMPDERGRQLLLDIGTEELGHVEMIQTIIYQLTKGATKEELFRNGLAPNYVEHGNNFFPTDTSGVPFNAGGIGITGNWEADLTEDLAAEQKARVTYEHLIDLATDEELLRPLLYLRQREIVHFTRFKQLLELYNKEFKK